MIRKLLFFFLFTLSSQLIFAQPPGADCASATPITLIPGGTAMTGTQSVLGLGNDYDATYNCGQAGFYGLTDDGVYSINVVNPGDHTFSFTTAGTNWKYLAVYPACPLVPGACLGGFATGGASAGTTGPINLGIGTYYIIIDAAPFGGAAPHPEFELEIEAPISNDTCSGAIELNSNINCAYQTFSNAGSTDSGVADPGCALYAGDDVWFSYVVNSTGELTVETGAGTITDSGLAIYSGTCGALVLEDCDDDSGPGAASLITLTGRTPGETLYIRVWDYNGGQGTFDICITTPVPVGTIGVSLDCSADVSLEMSSDIGLTCGAVTGTTSLGSTISGNLNAADPAVNQLATAINSADPCAFDAVDTANYEAISFTVTVTGTYTFEMDAPTPAFDGMGYIVIDDGLFVPGSCAFGTYIAGDDDGPNFPRPEITATLTTGVSYLLITTVYGATSTTHTGPYSWTVSFPVSTPQPDWFTTAVGGVSIGSGDGFNPVGVPGSGLPDTNTPGIYSFWAECPLFPGTRVQADYVIGKVWDGSASSDWTNPLNWSEDTVPTNSQCVYIPSGMPNDPVINDNDNGDGYSLTVQTGATLSLTSDADSNSFGSSLTIQDQIDIQGTGTLTVEDSASLIQVDDNPSAANSGDIILNRNSDIRLTDYVYWSSPVQGFDVSDVYGAFTPTNYIFEWIPTIATGTFTPGVLPTGGMPICYGNWNSLGSGTMNLGKGYISRAPTNHTAGISTATSVFTGVPNNGVITQPINSGTNSFAYSNYTYNPYGTDVLTVTPFDDNWNLLGNPYPSALDAQSFLTHPNNSIIEGAVHIWTHGIAIGNNGDSFYDDFLLSYSVNDYITYNFSGTNTYTNETFSGKIGSGQGFFVLALNDSESGSVTFNNSMRDRTHSNSDFYRVANEDNENTNKIERNRIWLNLVDQDGATSSILVGYIEGATQDKDRLYDAYTREVNEISMYSKIGDQRMSIQGRALPFDQNDQVRLGTVIPQAGEYTIAINNVDGLFLDESQSIYLEDTYSGVIHNLRAAPYTFTETESINYDDRFVLRYTDDALSINELESDTGLSILTPKGEYIKIHTDNSTIETVTVYDLLGRALINEININTSEFVINNHNLASGAYLVKVALNNGLSKTQKVILKH